MRLRLTLTAVLAVCVGVAAPGLAQPRSGAITDPTAMLRILNSERAANKLAPLDASSTLHAVANRVLHFNACDGHSATSSGGCVSVDPCPDKLINASLLSCRLQNVLTGLHVQGHVYPFAIWDESDASTLSKLKAAALKQRGSHVGLAFRAELLGAHNVWILVNQ